MNSNAIFYPDFAMFILTAVVFLINLAFRRQAAKARLVPVSHFKVFQGGTPTDAMLQSKNNITNLFETPVFFYLITVILFVTNCVDTFALGTAWAYVGLRALHSWEYLTSHFVFLFLF